MSPDCALQATHNNESLCLTFLGSWTVHIDPCALPDFSRLFTPETKHLSFDTRHLIAWDSRFLVELNRITTIAEKQGITIETEGLPSGVSNLLSLSRKKTFAPPDDSYSDPGILNDIGSHAIGLGKQAIEMLAFTGEILLSYIRFFTGQARCLKNDFIFFLYDCGPQALPIVALISFLVGFTLAFIGSVQLKMFGADIYVANLVGLTMTREMGPMMAAIIMAGRTGASYAAQLGTMQVNEEIDALDTMGINSFDFLVLPRLTALIIMMPMLAICADFIGIFGGFFIGCLSLDISPILYYEQTIKAVHLNHFLVGMIKSVVFGYLVAFCGCIKGMQCGRSADAVGKATTSAVVTAIVLIVISDAGFTFFFNVLGI